MAYQFFSEADIDPKTGKVKSQYPIWYNPKLIRELEDAVMEREMALESGQVPRGYEVEYRDNLSRLQDQLAKVKDLTAVDDAKNDRGLLGKAVKQLAKIITEELPKQALCDRNLVDPNMEFTKMTTPYISIKDDNMAELAKACNVPITPDGKITREGASIMWKIGRKYLGEYANTEILRK